MPRTLSRCIRGICVPDHGDGRHQDDEVGDHARCTIADEEVRDVYTSSRRSWIHTLIPEVAVRSTLNNSDDDDRDPPANDEEENKVKNLAEEWDGEEPIVEEDDGQLGQGNDRAVEEFVCPEDLWFGQKLDGRSTFPG
jgi:hypothetical protein